MDSPMTDDELNVAVAEKVLRRRVVALDWPCGCDPECGHFSAHMEVNPDGTPHFDRLGGFWWFGTPHAVYLANPDAPWPPVLEEDDEDGFDYCLVDLVPVEDVVNHWGDFGEVVEAMAERGWERLTIQRVPVSNNYLAIWGTVTSGVPERNVSATDTTRLRAANRAAIKAVEGSR